MCVCVCVCVCVGVCVCVCDHHHLGVLIVRRSLTLSPSVSVNHQF